MSGAPSTEGNAYPEALEAMRRESGPSVPSNDVIVALKRPEGYEDVAAELVASDALEGVDFDWELITPPDATHGEGK